MIALNSSYDLDETSCFTVFSCNKESCSASLFFKPKKNDPQLDITLVQMSHSRQRFWLSVVSKL